MLAAITAILVVFSNIVETNVLHFGSEGVAFVIILRILDKIRIERYRLDHWVVAVTFFVVSVIKIKCATCVLDARVKVAFFGSVIFLMIAL